MDKQNVISSGNFMVVDPHADPTGFMTPRRDGRPTFERNLQDLFDCMNTAFKHGVTTPRWKKFNNMNIRLKDRIRLNNAIWRTWHIQYLDGLSKVKRKKLIEFVTPLDSADYTAKPDVHLLEGNYWRQQIQAVIDEYKTWRKFFWKQAERSLKRLKQKPCPAVPIVDTQPLDNALVIDSGHFYDIPDSLTRISNAIPTDSFFNMESFGFLSDNGQGFLNDIGMDPMESMDFLYPKNSEHAPYDSPFNSKNSENQNHRYQAASKNMPVYIQSEPPRTLQQPIQQTLAPQRHIQHQQQQAQEPMAMEYSQPNRQPPPLRPPLPQTQFEPPQQTQQQMAPSRVRVNSEMDLPIEEIGTVPIDQIDRESHVILPDGKQIVLLQLLEDGSYAQIRGDSVSKNVIFSQTKDSHAVRISNSATDSYQPQAQSSQYGNNDYDQKTEIDNGMSQDNGINVQQYQQGQEDEQSAERRRRSTMKQGFDHLEALLNETMANNTPGHSVPTKISKAGLLMKAKDTIIRHQMEKKRKQQEIDLLRRECENLQRQISCAQEQLPETGFPLSKVRSDKNHREFLQYVAARTEQNYKFFPFYLIMRKMFESYNQVVAVQDAGKFRRTSQEWLQRSCSLPHVRPAVSDATRFISTDTCIFRPNADFPADCVRKMHELLKDSSKY